MMYASEARDDRRRVLESLVPKAIQVATEIEIRKAIHQGHNCCCLTFIPKSWDYQKVLRFCWWLESYGYSAKEARDGNIDVSW